MNQLTSTVPLRPLRQPPRKVQVPLPRSRKLGAPAPVMRFDPPQPRTGELVRRGKDVEIPHLGLTVPAEMGSVTVTRTAQDGDEGPGWVVRHSALGSELGTFGDASMARAYAEGLARVAHCSMRWEGGDGKTEERSPEQLDVPLVQRLAGAPLPAVPDGVARFVRPDGTVCIPQQRPAARPRPGRVPALAAVTWSTLGAAGFFFATGGPGTHWREAVTLLLGMAVGRMVHSPLDTGPVGQVYVNRQGVSCVDGFGDVKWNIPATALESLYTDEEGNVLVASDDEMRLVTAGPQGGAWAPLITAALLGQVQPRG